MRTFLQRAGPILVDNALISTILLINWMQSRRYELIRVACTFMPFTSVRNYYFHVKESVSFQLFSANHLPQAKWFRPHWRATNSIFETIKLVNRNFSLNVTQATAYETSSCKPHQSQPSTIWTLHRRPMRMREYFVSRLNAQFNSIVSDFCASIHSHATPRHVSILLILGAQLRMLRVGVCVCVTVVAAEHTEHSQRVRLRVDGVHAERCSSTIYGSIK